MSVDYLSILCDTSNNDAIRQVKNTFNSLASSGTVGLKNIFFKQEKLYDYEEIINFSEHAYADNDVVFTIEAVIDDMELLFERILKYFDSLGIKMYRCVYVNSGGGESSHLKYTNGIVKWSVPKHLPTSEANIYISGTFDEEWTQSQQDIILNMGASIINSYEKANILVIGKGFDRDIREYFLTKSLPIINEQETEFLFEDNLYV